ncbi:PiggyBac transposable element-derived protein 4 [Anthophora quadrimaculata]
MDEMSTSNEQQTSKILKEEEIEEIVLEPDVDLMDDAEFLDDLPPGMDNNSDVDMLSMDSDSSESDSSESDDEDEKPSFFQSQTADQSNRWTHSDMTTSAGANTSRTQIPFTGNPGLTALPDDNSPIGFFYFIFTEYLWEMIVCETNKSGQEFQRESSSSRMKHFKNITVEEMKKFLGLLFHMGHVKFPKINDYWRKDEFFKTTLFGNIMSRNRFLQILKAFHCNFEANSKVDRLGKIRPLVEFFNERMKTIYSPSKEICIDKCMVLWRGQLVFRQYVKNKKHKYGVELYMLTEPNGLVVNFVIYTGKGNKDIEDTDHASKVVTKLMGNLLGKGHSVYIDNVYNSIELATDLLKSNTYITGPLHRKRGGQIKGILNKKLRKGEIIQRITENGVCVFKWRDTRKVLFLSSEFTSDFKTSRNGNLIPEAILKYNQYMGGTDRRDQMLSCYSCETKTLRWYVKIAFHIFQLIMLNSYLLHKKSNSQSKLTFVDFRIKVIESLLGNVSNTVTKKPTPKKIHLPSHCPRNESNRVLRKRCMQCTKINKRKETTYFCEDCENKPGLCLEPCFRDFHQY